MRSPLYSECVPDPREAFPDHTYQRPTTGPGGACTPGTSWSRSLLPALLGTRIRRRSFQEGQARGLVPHADILAELLESLRECPSPHLGDAGGCGSSETCGLLQVPGSSSNCFACVPSMPFNECTPGMSCAVPISHCIASHPTGFFDADLLSIDDPGSLTSSRRS